MLHHEVWVVVRWVVQDYTQAITECNKDLNISRQYFNDASRLIDNQNSKIILFFSTVQMSSKLLLTAIRLYSSEQ